MNPSASSALPPRLLRLTGALTLVLLLCSCRLNITEDQAKERIGKVLAARKPGSLKEWKDAEIDGQKAEHYIKNRLAILANPKTADLKKKGRYKYGLTLIPANGTIYFGSAVPVAADGYFLTAGHNDSSQIFTWNDRIELVKRKPRVVWKGRAEKGEPDLAILHLPMKLPLAATLRKTDPLRKGERVLANGVGVLNEAAGGGRIIAVSNWKISPGGARWREVIHSAPTVPGDSGGPLIDEKGNLIGIHSILGIKLFMNVWLWNRDYVFGYYGEAVSPDPVWLEKIISSDRKRRRG